MSIADRRHPEGSRFAVAKHLRTEVREVLGHVASVPLHNADIDAALRRAALGEAARNPLERAAWRVMNDRRLTAR
jgi:hypothetical protein